MDAQAASLRPPGAGEEEDFLSACSRCGLCVQACPYDTLKLATWLDKAPNGTPFFEAREVPCEMCDHIPCVEACPTGALDHDLTDIDDARMGVAVIVDRENCLNLQGMRCDVCYRVCPLIDEAITLAVTPEANKGGLPGNVTAEVKPIAKDTNEIVVTFKATDKAPVGTFTAVLTATIKQGKTTVTQTVPGIALTIQDPPKK